MIAEEIASFLGAIRYERSLAENTCTAYARDLAAFAVFLKKRGKTAAAMVTREDIAAHILQVREKGLASRSRARRLVAIRMWLQYLKERRMIAANPAESLSSPKVAKPLPRVLSEAEVFKMLEAVAGTDPVELRDRAMLEVMYGCGLRVSELCALQLGDLVGEGELLRILGKGSKERIVPIGGFAGRALAAYLAAAREFFTKGDRSETALFVTRLKRPFTRQGVYQIVKARALKAGIAPERITPHVLRHCFASHLLQHGADIRAIQELLGHADIGTTQIYTHIDENRFAAVHKRFHPRG